MTALREGNIVLRAELFPRSTSSDLPQRSFSRRPSRWQPIRRRPSRASPSSVLPPSLSHSSHRLCASPSFYLSGASLLAAFHEAQHLPVVTKKSSNHPRRSSGGLSFALRASGVGSLSARVSKERTPERRERARIATEGGRKGERRTRYIGCKANRARAGETERRNRRTRDEEGRSEHRGGKGGERVHRGWHEPSGGGRAGRDWREGGRTRRV